MNYQIANDINWEGFLSIDLMCRPQVFAYQN